MKSGKTRCTLCPKGCNLSIGEVGDCGVRKNSENGIECLTFNHPCTIHIDPIEKKPLYHFLPGSNTFSIATQGCNLHCINCQNWPISQIHHYHPDPETIGVHQIIEQCMDRGCPSISYTYTEPLVSYEYTLDCCKNASDEGLRNILVTAAYINPQPLRTLCKYVDAANVDLKAFSNSFYETVCSARLKPVLKALTIMMQCGVHLEITNLLIPEYNDSNDDLHRLCDWIAQNLGLDIPIHFSRFFPTYLMIDIPPTPKESLLNAYRIAKEYGFKHIYLGNMHDGEGEYTWLSCPDIGCHFGKEKIQGEDGNTIQ